MKFLLLLALFVFVCFVVRDGQGSTMSEVCILMGLGKAGVRNEK